MPTTWDYIKLFAELFGNSKKQQPLPSEKKIIKEVKKGNTDLKKTLHTHLIINIIVAFVFTILGYILGAFHPFVK